MELAHVGTSVPRVEDPRLVRGQGRYVADVRLPGMVHAAILRSPFAHAEVRSIDVSRALERPGVLDAITFADIAEVPVIPMRLAHHPELGRALQRVLADRTVRYVGEPVAVIVAENRYLAEDALGHVDVDYEPLPVVVDCNRARAEGAPVLHRDVPGNVVLEFSQESGDVAAVEGREHRVIEETFFVQRHSGVPLENRGVVAEFSDADGMLTVWGASKVIHFNRRVLSELMGILEDRIRMVETDVGGGFGIRGEFYPEDLLIPFLARRVGRPVAWIEDRIEHFRAANHSREQIHDVRVGVDEHGVILWLDDRVLNDMGAYIRTHGATVPTMTAAYLPGPYRIPNYRCHVTCVLTNKTPTGTYRAPGRFEATFVRERLIDIIAAELEVDPAEIRARNFIPAGEMPYDTGLVAHGTPVVYDSGDYEKHLNHGLDVFGYLEAMKWAADMRRAGRAIGVGLGWFVEKTGYGPWEYSRVEMSESGAVTVFSGISNVGQGPLTSLTQIVADELSMGMEDIRVVLGDTNLVAYGHGSFASRGAVMAGNASAIAAGKLREKLFEAAARILECSTEDLAAGAGTISVRGAPDSSLSYSEIAAALSPSRAVELGMEPGLSEAAFFHVDRMVYPYGAHLALVEVDRDTGHIDIIKYMVTYDVGRAVNPMILDGQLVGGFAQGLGGALFEELRYDEAGQLVSGTFMDYLIPTSAETPPVLIELTEDAPSPENPLGLKGAGEGGTVGVGAALANAVVHALGGRVSLSRLPLTPEYVLQLVRDAAVVTADGGT